MFKNKNADGSLNICGSRIKELRIEKGWSQRELADRLQLNGLDIGKNAIQQIESKKRFVTDLELLHFAAMFSVTADWLIDGE